MVSDYEAYTTITDPEPHDVKVALAGFAAVGALLGDAAERENRAAEQHAEDSDLERAPRHAGEAASEPDAVEAHVTESDADVRDLVKEPEISGAITEIASRLWDGQSHMSGDHVRHIIKSVAGEVDLLRASVSDEE